MIKLTRLNRRKSGTSLEEYSARWRGDHAKRVEALAHTLRLKRYVQSHRRDSEMVDSFIAIRDWLPNTFDGISEFWWDNADEMNAALTSKEGAAAFRAIDDDAHAFMDPRGAAFVSVEHVITDDIPAGTLDRLGKSSYVKFVNLVHRRADFTPEAYYKRWHDGHGSLAKGAVHFTRVKRYVQNHRAAHPVIDQSSNMEDPIHNTYDGMTLVWWESEPEMRRGLTDPEGEPANMEMAADENKFIDPYNTTVFLADEYIVLNR